MNGERNRSSFGIGKENLGRKLFWDLEMILDGFFDRKFVLFWKFFYFYFKETSILFKINFLFSVCEFWVVCRS